MSNTTFLVSKKKHAVSLHLAGRFAEAKAVCEDICNNNPHDPEIWTLLSGINGALGFFEGAEKCACRAIELAPNSVLGHFNRAVAFMNMFKPDKAVNSFQQVLRYNPNDERAIFLMGICYSQQHGYLEEGIECIEKVLGMYTEPPCEVLVKLAYLYEKAGAVDKSMQKAQQALENSCHDPELEIALAKLDKRDRRFDEARARLERLMEHEGAPDAKKSEAANLLGQVLDRLGEYPLAFNAFRLCQRIAADMAGERFNSQYPLDKIYRIRSVVTEKKVAGWQSHDYEDGLPSPVFLVAFPRSGTTLTEQVIASHPKIVSSDEMPIVYELIAHLCKLSGDSRGYPFNLNDLNEAQIYELRKEYWNIAERLCGVEPGPEQFLDKLPLNIVELCLINRIFPKAKVVLLLRDPRDVCLSCYMQHFSPNNAMVNFFDLNSTARLYAATMSLWCHYESVLNLDYISIRYESLINDFESQASKLLEFIGPGWHEDILRFNERKGVISTPSYQDVSEPIYTRASGRWRNYKDELRPVMQTLEPYVELFGYSSD